MDYYETEKQEAAKMLAAVVDNGGDAYVALLGSIMSALYNVASELHEINKNIRAGVDDGR